MVLYMYFSKFYKPKTTTIESYLVRATHKTGHTHWWPRSLGSRIQLGRAAQKDRS